MSEKKESNIFISDEAYEHFIDIAENDPDQLANVVWSLLMQSDPFQMCFFNEMQKLAEIQARDYNTSDHELHQNSAKRLNVIAKNLKQLANELAQEKSWFQVIQERNRQNERMGF